MLGFVARLFPARQAPPDAVPGVGAGVLPEPATEPPEPEPAEETAVPEAVSAEAEEDDHPPEEPEVAPAPAEPALVSLTLHEAISVAREARIDCFQLQFLAREWERKRESGEGVPSDWSQLEQVAEGRLRKAGFLAEQQRLQLVSTAH